MLKNTSLPELQINQQSPEKLLATSWMITKQSNKKWVYDHQTMTTKSHDIIDMRTISKIFPGRKRPDYSRKLRFRNKRRSYDQSYGRNLLGTKYYSEDAITEKTNASTILPHQKVAPPQIISEDSDMFGPSDSHQETDENTGRYVGKEAFAHYYK